MRVLPKPVDMFSLEAKQLTYINGDIVALWAGGRFIREDDVRSSRMVIDGDLVRVASLGDWIVKDGAKINIMTSDEFYKNYDPI